MADIIVVHGAPGSGKSTQSERLSHFLMDGRPVCHIPVGDRLRAIRNGEFKSTYSNQVNDLGSSSMLDHALVNAIIFEAVSLCPKDSVILIDGYPRFLDAMSPFIEAVAEGGHKLLGSIHLKISQETSMIRLGSRGLRRGERFLEMNNAVVEKRFGEHIRYTTEVVAALDQLAPVIEIDANLNKEAVSSLFEEAVKKLAND